jgi:hypothetical protein
MSPLCVASKSEAAESVKVVTTLWPAATSRSRVKSYLLRVMSTLSQFRNARFGGKSQSSQDFDIAVLTARRWYIDLTGCCVTATSTGWKYACTTSSPSTLPRFDTLIL